MHRQMQAVFALLTRTGSTQTEQPSDHGCIFTNHNCAQNLDVVDFSQEVKQRQQNGSQTPALASVNDSDCHFRRGRFFFNANEASDAKSWVAGFGCIQRNPSNVIVLVNFGEVMQLLSA